MEETLTLADGTVLNGYVLEQDEIRLYVYLDNSTMADAFRILNDGEKTAVIVARRHGEEKVYTGYDHLYSLTENRGGMVSGSLKKS